MERLKIHLVFHKGCAVKNTDVTAFHLVHGCPACDIFNDCITAKVCAKRLDEFLGEIFLQVPKYAIKRYAVHENVVGMLRGRQVHNLQFIPRTALRNRALPIRAGYAVYLAVDGEE